MSRDEIEERKRDYRVYRWAAVIMLLVAITYGLTAVMWELRTLLLDVLLAITVASAIAPLAEKLERIRIPRFLTVLTVYAGVVLFYAGVFWALATPLKEQSQHLAQQLPTFSEIIKNGWEQLLGFLGDKAAMLEIHATDFREPALTLAKKTLDVTAGFMGLAVNGVLILFLAAYFVIEAEHIWKNLVLWVPPQYRDRIGSLIRPLGAKMGGYVRGQILVSTAVACFFGVGFTVIGLNYGLVLGLVAGILNLIPYVGSLFATVLALFVASTQSITIFLLTLVVFAVEQFAESNFIVPQLLGRQVDMHPLIVMFAILVGGSLGGGVGALAAVPLTGALLLIAHEFYFKPINGANKGAAVNSASAAKIAEESSERPVASGSISGTADLIAVEPGMVAPAKPQENQGTFVPLPEAKEQIELEHKKAED